METVIFVSDIHIGVSDDVRVQAVITFLEYCKKKNARVYILGDLFNFWVGDAQYKIPNMRKCIDAMIDIGKDFVYFLPGNRDFLFPPLWQKLGGKVAEEGTSLQLGNQNICLYHGDGFCVHDRQYQAYRKILRQHWIYKFSQTLPTWLCLKIGHFLRGISKKCVQKKTEFVLKFDLKYVSQLMKSLEASFLICGHVHRMEQITLSEQPLQKLIILPESSETIFRYLVWDFSGYKFEEFNSVI